MTTPKIATKIATIFIIRIVVIIIVFKNQHLQVRSSVLLDLYTATDSHDGGALVAYRKGDFKVD